MFFESACNRTGGNKYETDQNRNLRTRPRSRRMVERICWKRFRTFSLNFHMSLEGTDLDKLALSTEQILAGTDSKITTLGYYCNPIQYPEHRKTFGKGNLHY